MKRAGLWLALGWGLVAALASLPVLRLEPNLLEEGVSLHIAQRLAHGERLYRDVVFFTGPLPFELLAGLFRAFGERLPVARLALLPLIAGAAAASFALARAAGAGAFAHVVGALWASAPALLFPLLSIYFYTTLAFDLIPLAAWLAWVGAVSPLAALGAGVVVAAIALCKQSFGALLAAGFVVALGVFAPRGRRARSATLFAVGGALAALATLALYAARGELGTLVDGLVRLPLELDQSFRAPYLNLWPPGRLSAPIAPNATLYLPLALYLEQGVFREVGAGWVLLAQALYALPLVALAATALRLLHLRRPRGAALALALGGVALLCVLINLYPRGDWGHLAFALPLAGQQLVLALAGGAGEPPHSRGARITAGVLAVLLLTGGAGFTRWLYGLSWPIHYFGERVPLYVTSPSTKMPTYPRIIEYLRAHTRPGEPIFVARQEPLLYFATDTTNPTPYVGILLARREEQQRRILKELGRVRFVVMSDLDQPLYAYYADELPHVWEYLERHFQLPADFPIDHNSFAQVLVRGRDRGETLLDLARVRERGRAWVRDQAGSVRPEPDHVPRIPAQKLRRLLAIRLGTRGGGIDFPVEIPDGGARLQSSIGVPWLVSLEGRHDQPGSASQVVSISLDGERFTPLASLALRELPESARNRWTPLEADLSAYAGQRVWLRLEVASDEPIEEGSLGWFGSPRLTRAQSR